VVAEEPEITRPRDRLLRRLGNSIFIAGRSRLSAESIEQTTLPPILRYCGPWPSQRHRSSVRGLMLQRRESST
jgi:hypothetical protein